jgi:hypothetical protein
MRGHKWKMLEAALGMDLVTSREFAAVTGLAPEKTHFYTHELVDDGYLKLVKEVPPDRGGRPMKFYAWTGKRPPSRGGIYATTPDDTWSKADAVLHKCFDRMVRIAREDSDASACAV